LDTAWLYFLPAAILILAEKRRDGGYGTPAPPDFARSPGNLSAASGPECESLARIKGSCQATPGAIDDALTELLRSRVKRLLHQTVEARLTEVPKRQRHRPVEQG